MLGHIIYIFEIKKRKIIFQVFLDTFFILALFIQILFPDNTVVFLICTPSLIIDTLMILGLSDGTPSILLNNVKKNYILFCNSVNKGIRRFLSVVTILRIVTILKNVIFLILLYSNIIVKLNINLQFDGGKIIYCIILFYFSEVFLSILSFLMLKSQENNFFAFNAINYGLLYFMLKIVNSFDNICFSVLILLVIVGATLGLITNANKFIERRNIIA